MSDKTKSWAYVKGVDDISIMTPNEVFNRGFDYGYEDAQAKMKAMAAQADLSGVKTILETFAEKLKADFAALAKVRQQIDYNNLSSMTDRQISNVMHGRDKDDNGEFTASSMGAAHDALHAQGSAQDEIRNATHSHMTPGEPRDIFREITNVYAKREIEGQNVATGVKPRINDYSDAIAPHAAALRMVRNAIEELFGPYADIESEEAVLLRGPEPHHEAEAIIAALQNVGETMNEFVGDPVGDYVMIDRSLIRAAINEIREWKVNKDGDDQVMLNLQAAIGEKLPLPELIVTRGDGVPLPDQASALEAFKAQAGRANRRKLDIDNIKVLMRQCSITVDDLK